MTRWLALLLVGACHEPAGQAAPSASDAPSASVTAAASAAESAAAPWFAGAWRGSYHAELSRIESAPGSPREWQQDDGKPGSGSGTLSLSAATDGSVTGSATGALGEQQISGRFEGDHAALTLTPLGPSGFHGVALAARSAGGMSGSLQASSADSLKVRRASLKLTRDAVGER